MNEVKCSTQGFNRSGRPYKDIIGQKFSMLRALRFFSRIRGVTKWMFRCDCGVEKEINYNAVVQLKTLSCGCYNARRKKKEKHGMSRSGTYRSWAAMIQRCTNPNAQFYWEYYGGVGVSVHRDWIKFENFFRDMGVRPKGKTLDRYPNQTGNYEPGNCRWATPREQMENTSRNSLHTYNGETLTISQWARKIGIKKVTLQGRLMLGWSIQKAVLTPVRKRNRDYSKRSR